MKLTVVFCRVNVNIHPMIIWNLIEVFRDPKLLSRVRAELTAANVQGVTSNQDVEKLLSLPLLQSIYAELLRLRVEVSSVLSSAREEIRINSWRVPKDRLVIIPTGEAHKDASFWNTRNGKYPLDQFWADRFLAHPGDPQSGPRKDGMLSGERWDEDMARAPTGPTKAKFIGSGLADSFIPWGVGERVCPGRGIARRAIVAVVAIMVERFDMEILSTDFELNPAFYGLGTQRPLRRIPFRIRKRKTE